MKQKRMGWIFLLISATLIANAEELLESELIFEQTERFPSSHCSDIEVLPNGDLFVVWYAGSVEKARDVALVRARRPARSQTWEPGIVIDTPGKSDGNPVLAQPKAGLLELYYQVMHGSPKGVTQVGTGWTTCDIRRIVSRDEGRTWSEPEMIRPEWGYITKGALIRLQDGTWLLPLSDERNFYSLAALSTDGRKTWTYTAPIDNGWGFDIGNNEPTVVQRGDGTLVMIMRGGDPRRRAWKSLSFDHGRTWTDPGQVEELPNPDSAMEMYKIQSGRWILAFNDSESGRTPLTVALSDDEGETWPIRRHVETAPGEFSYPSLTQGPDGVIHMTYTYHRKTIKHIAFREKWVGGAAAK